MRSIFKIALLILMATLSACLPFGEKGPLRFKLRQATILSPVIRGEAKYDFENLSKHILVPKCVRCHGKERAEPKNDPIYLETYEQLTEDRFIPVLIKGKPLRSRLYLEVERGTMPPKVPLHENEVKYIKEWIARCAPKLSTDTPCGGGPGDDDDEPGDDDDEPGDDDDEPGDDDDEPGDDDDEPGDDDDEPMD